TSRPVMPAPPGSQPAHSASMTARSRSPSLATGSSLLRRVVDGRPALSRAPLIRLEPLSGRPAHEWLHRMHRARFARGSAIDKVYRLNYRGACPGHVSDVFKHASRGAT